MADWQPSYWTPSPNAPARDDRAGGEYSTYRPDLLMNRPLALASDVSDLSWQVENAVRRLGDRPGACGLEGLARFLLRSEAIASSRIEGLQVSPQQVGLAEIAEEEALTAQSVNITARRVAANISALRRATHELAEDQKVSLPGIEQLQGTLLSEEPELLGILSEVMVQLTYDPEANAEYLSIVRNVNSREAVVQVIVDDPRLRGEVILDLDNSGYLLGVELIGATDLLRSDTLAAAES